MIDGLGAADVQLDQAEDKVLAPSRLLSAE